MTGLDVGIGLRNYRCFGDEPARFRIREGFSAFIGSNNSGKSSLLRMLYEFRPLFQYLANPNEHSTGNALSRGGAGTVWVPTLLPGERIARAGSHGIIEIRRTIRDSP